MNFTHTLCRQCTFPSRVFGEKAKHASKKRRRSAAVDPQGTGVATEASKKPPLFGEESKPRKNKALSSPDAKGHHHLKAYEEKFFGSERASTGDSNKGENGPGAPTTTQSVSKLVVDEEAPKWKESLPTATQLRLQGFGKPDKDHSATQEACAETTLHFVLRSGYLDNQSKSSLCAAHPLVQHLTKITSSLSGYDFRWLRGTDTDWASQASIPRQSMKAMLACLLHYNLDVSLLMRYLGGNYVGAHRDTERTVAKLRTHGISEPLISQYKRVMDTGCPRIFNTTITRENALKYWRAGNNPSIGKKLAQVMKTMNKEHRNKFVIAIPSWTWRFIPHLFITPQHNHERKGHKDRLIYDAAYMHDADSIPINMMTEDASRTELRCDFGKVKSRLYKRIYNLRITYPKLDLVVHANDVKSCFRQLKHHPDVMGAFSYIIQDILFLQCALTFGSDFSPASWEVLRRIIEALAEALFEDETLRAKHKHRLEKLVWQRSLGSSKAKLTPAKADSINKGVLDSDRKPVKTPHDMFVDDDLYAEVSVKECVEQACAASIEAMFITLGESDLTSRQDPVSWDKFTEMTINWTNRALGTDIDTRKMAVRTPVEYVSETVNMLKETWHKGKNTKQSFTLPDAEKMAGRLGYISETAPWLRFMMSGIYSSMAHALGESQSHLVTNSKNFRKLLKVTKKEVKFQCQASLNKRNLKQYGKATQHNKELRHLRYAQSQVAKKVHHTRVRFQMNRTLRREIELVHCALSSDWIDMWRPIGHLIPRDPSCTAWSDSCLHAAGGYSFDLGFWWYIQWPSRIYKCTLKFVTTNKDGILITINALEYASLIINYVAVTHILTKAQVRMRRDPHPVVLLLADNRSAEAWLRKASSASEAGRALGYIQAAFMVNNPVGINVGHVTSKDNKIADRISRVTSELTLLAEMKQLHKDYPMLRSCKRFRPSAELVSLILDTLSTKKFVNPLLVSRRILSSPGEITM